MPSEIKITMLGHRGVGKTSLLTAMYEQFDSTIGNAGLQLTPDLESSELLQQRLGELKGLFGNFDATGGLEGTENPQSYHFGLGKIGSKPSLNIVFQDFPGGYLVEKGGEFVKQVMNESIAVLIAIDAPALMEDNGKWSELMNKPKQICDIFKNVYGDLQQPRLVIFAPIRCEKYLQNDAEANKLLDLIRQEYAELFKFFRSENLLNKVACVVTPVQTVGTVFFNHLKIEDKKPRFYFRKFDHDARYTPKDSDQPLRYILTFILKLHYDNKWGFFSPLHRFLGWDEYLLEAARKSAAKCKSTGGFAVLQGYYRFKV